MRTAIAENAGLRRWISRAFLVSILVYLVVIGFLLAESITGASRWAPYGVNIPVFIVLILASEIIVALTAVWIFKEDSGIWPDEVFQGWRAFRSGKIGTGLKQMAVGAWDISLIDLRLRTRLAIFLGRLNRVAALVPLIYILGVTVGSSIPWGMRGSAILDVLLTLGVWLFMEVVMVQPQPAAASRAIPPPAMAEATYPGPKESRYEIRAVRFDDIPRILELERIKWRDQAANRSTIESRLSRYPQGQIAVEHLTVEHGKVTRRSVVAWVTVMAIDAGKVANFGTWDQVSGDGTLSTVDPAGNTIVGVNLTSVTNGATYMVLGEMLAAVVEWKKDKFIGGGRLNGFVAFNEHRATEGHRAFAPGEYANLREIRGYRINELRIEQGLPVLRDGAYVEHVNQLRRRNLESPLPEEQRPDYVCANLRGYLSIPGSYVVELIPGYFPDPASDDWGVVIAWDNPVPRLLRHFPWVKSIVANRIRHEVNAEWESRKQKVRELSRARARSRAQEATIVDLPVAEPEPQPAQLARVG